MTKARARARAKAKAGQKARKKAVNADQASQPVRPGQFDPKANTPKFSGAAPSNKVFGAARRGAARSN